VISGSFVEKSPVMSGSFVESDLQRKAPYASSPPCTLFYTGEGNVQFDFREVGVKVLIDHQHSRQILCVMTHSQVCHVT